MASGHLVGDLQAVGAVEFLSRQELRGQFAQLTAFVGAAWARKG